MLTVDTERLPLLVLAFEGELAADDVDRYEDALRERLSAPQPFAMVITAKDVPMPPVALLQRFAGWMRGHHDAMAAHCVAVGMHLDSAVLRGAVKFINKIVSPPSPQGIFATLEETEAWTRGQLLNQGLEAPE